MILIMYEFITAQSGSVILVILSYSCFLCSRVYVIFTSTDRVSTIPSDTVQTMRLPIRHVVC